MNIRFDNKRWEKIKKHSQKWWNRQLDRPLIQIRINDLEPLGPKCDLPFHFFTSFYNDDVSVERIVDVWDHNLSKQDYLGDAFPYVIPYFGPGVLSAMLGAVLENGNDTVWYHTPQKNEMEELDFKFIPNKWFDRIKNLILAAQNKWDGAVQISMTDLGGASDILAVFRSSQGLLLDLYDKPQHVQRCIKQLHDIWWRVFKEFSNTANKNPGCTTWAPIFSTGSNYMLQSDFCYMISPEMFDRFIKPELELNINKLDNSFYHLDGVGQLNHLDSLLSIEKLDGIQWIPGEGQKDITNWPQVFQKITQKSKLIQFFSNQCKGDPFEALDIITDQTGTANNIIYIMDIKQKDRKKAEKLLDKYGIS